MVISLKSYTNHFKVLSLNEDINEYVGIRRGVHIRFGSWELKIITKVYTQYFGK